MVWGSFWFNEFTRRVLPCNTNIVIVLRVLFNLFKDASAVQPIQRCECCSTYSKMRNNGGGVRLQAREPRWGRNIECPGEDPVSGITMNRTFSQDGYHAMPYHTIPYHTILYHGGCCRRRNRTRRTFGSSFICVPSPAVFGLGVYNFFVNNTYKLYGKGVVRQHVNTCGRTYAQVRVGWGTVACGGIAAVGCVTISYVTMP